MGFREEVRLGKLHVSIMRQLGGSGLTRLATTNHGPVLFFANDPMHVIALEIRASSFFLYMGGNSPSAINKEAHIGATALKDQSVVRSITDCIIGVGKNHYEADDLPRAIAYYWTASKLLVKSDQQEKARLVVRGLVNLVLLHPPEHPNELIGMSNATALLGMLLEGAQLEQLRAELALKLWKRDPEANSLEKVLEHLEVAQGLLALDSSEDADEHRAQIQAEIARLGIG